MYEMFLPKPGDILQIFMAWYGAAEKSRKKTFEMLREVSLELDALSAGWTSIAAEVQSAYGSNKKINVNEMLWKQTSHYGALKAFAQYLSSDRLKVPSSELTNMRTLLNNALDTKGGLYFLMVRVFQPDHSGEEGISEYDRAILVARLSSRTTGIPKVDDILDRRAQWATMAHAEELAEEEKKKAAISDESMKELSVCVSQLSALAGQFRAAVAYTSTN